jgi:DNA polymerase-3 subunit delta
MTFEVVIDELKTGKYRPVYFLTGEEPYFIDIVTDFITANALKENDKAFNQLVIYGKDTDMANIVSLARRYPMMTDKQLIVVREAQHLKSLEDLEKYLSVPMPSTILVFAYKYKKIDKRTRIAKILSEKFVLMESDKIREDRMPAWVMNHGTRMGYKIDQKSATLLVDFLGNDIGKIVSELVKLTIVLPIGTNTITADVIEKNIGISKDFNNFELNRAVVYKDVAKANRIIKYFASNPRNNPVIVTLSAMFYYFTKILTYHALPDKNKDTVARALGINAWFIPEYQQAARNYPLEKSRQAISLIREYDFKIKGGSPASDNDLLKELVYKIMH